MFAPDIFQAAGSAEGDSVMQAMIVGLVNFLMTIVALWLVDKRGRKTLLLWGAVGMIISLAYLAFDFSKPVQNGAGVLIALLVYISFLPLRLHLLCGLLYPKFILIVSKELPCRSPQR